MIICWSPFISISIHAPREGSDPYTRPPASPWPYFYPRSPRGELRYQQGLSRMWTHFYPRSPRGERPFCPIRFSQCSQNFYPRSPRGERPSVPTRADTVQNFYPRSPRGERRIEQPNQHYHQHFYPRSPRGERRCPGRLFAVRCVISIHAPREGSDATSRGSDVCGAEISIHAPREGSDALAEHDVVCFVISIHAPREGSDYPYSLGRIVLMAFLSTLPARGATGATVSRSSMLD